jgi:hypothetical protein
MSQMRQHRTSPRLKKRLKALLADAEALQPAWRAPYRRSSEIKHGPID